ncbi:translation initiation factor [Lithospermum erythrorhizon]|uniref:Translation initiation factor n=1 Tax=Lithospermum erythrorhizon TaxID=34254 RepID=A0AAV3RC25_LITER
MTMTIGRTTRVIGWYHSHPHITVLPSHVDVRTQAMYQLLDSGFVGLIFSCYSEDALKVGRIQVIAFQSLDGKQNHALLPVSVSAVPISSVMELDQPSDKIVSKSGPGEEDIGSLRAAVKPSKAGGKSSDLEGFFNYAISRSESSHSTTNNDILDIDPLEMSDSMQEALHRSNMDVSGADYIRKEIPLYLCPSSAILNLEAPLGSFADLQGVLYDEEKTAYTQSISQSMRDVKVHPLTFIHHTSTYQASLCKLMEYCLSPAINALNDRLRENEIQLKLLAEEGKLLETEVLTIASSQRSLPSRSPQGSPLERTRGSAPFGHKDRDLHNPSEHPSTRNVGSPGVQTTKS